MSTVKHNRFAYSITAIACVLIAVASFSSKSRPADGDNPRKVRVVTFGGQADSVTVPLAAYADDALVARFGKDSVSVKLIGASHSVGVGSQKNKTYFGAISDKIDFVSKQTLTGVKETYTVKSSSIKSLAFLVKSKAQKKLQERTLYLYSQRSKVIIPPPIGWDADSTLFGIDVTLKGDTLKYSWASTDTLPLTYPVTIDPTVNIQQGSHASDAWIRSDQGTTNYDAGDGTGRSDLQGLNYDGLNIIKTYLVKFDSIKTKVAATGGDVLDSARLSIYFDGTYTVNRNGKVLVAPLKASFAEATVTWNTQPAQDTTWLLSDTVTCNVTTGAKWFVFDVTSYVDSIITYGRPDSGVAVRAYKYLAANAIFAEYIRGVEHATFAHHPKLDIYTSYTASVPDKPTLSIPLTQDSVKFLRLQSDDTQNDSTAYDYAYQWVLPADSSGKYLTHAGTASAAEVWDSEVTWQNNLVRTGMANQQVGFRTRVKHKSAPADTATSVLIAYKYSRIYPPDSLVVTEFGEVGAYITDYIWDVPTEENQFFISILDLLRHPRQFLDTVGVLTDTLGKTACDSNFALSSRWYRFAQLIPHTNNPFILYAKNGDSVACTTPDTFIIAKYAPAEGGGGGGVTISQVRNAISDTMDLARADWRSDINDSLNALSISYSALAGLDSGEIYIATYDSTSGETILKKLKSLLSYLGS